MSVKGTTQTEAVSLSGKIRAFMIDKTLSIPGACADAKATGDAIDKVVENVADEVAKTITPESIGARPNTWTPTATEVGAIPNTWMPTAADVGAMVANFGVLTDTDLFAWANRQSYGGSFTVNKSVTKTNVPDGPSGWFKGLLDYSSGGSRIILTTLSAGYLDSGETYTAIKAGGAWQTWKRLATTDYAVNKAGDTMTGDLNIESAVGAGVRVKRTSNNRQAKLEISDDGFVSIYNSDSTNPKDQSVLYLAPETVTELNRLVSFVHKGNTYRILHTGNKPSGSYTGNGEGTVTRPIHVGGIGSAVLVWSANGAAIVTTKGPIIVSGGSLSTIGGVTFNDGDGKMYLTTANSALNANGVTYNYRLL